MSVETGDATSYDAPGTVDGEVAVGSPGPVAGAVADPPVVGLGVPGVLGVLGVLGGAVGVPPSVAVAVGVGVGFGVTGAVSPGGGTVTEPEGDGMSVGEADGADGGTDVTGRSCPGGSRTVPGSSDGTPGTGSTEPGAKGVAPMKLRARTVV
ncbi:MULTISPECIES: hypothetical protein [unclassified Streptomyces]|uniref:hypothetical protein n=1 Tax=unclassified Streptomyces TaxID=2593676 RepID=UPI002473B15A|nr:MULTISPECIES: hypothetical protein [unclassified Streptomyces]